MRQQMSEMGTAVRAAGIRLAEQENENADALRNATETADGYPSVGGERNKNITCYVNDQQPGSATAGKFPCQAAPEAAGGTVIDWGYGNSQPAQPETVTTLAQNWMGVSRDLGAVLAAFHAGITAQFSSGTWTGTAAEAIRSGMDTYLNTSETVAREAFSNATAVATWAGTVAGTRSAFETFKAQQAANDFQYHSAPYSPVMAQQYLIAQQRLETAARDHINHTYNPGVTDIATGLHNLPTPTPPVHPGALGAPGGSGVDGGGGSGAWSGGGGLSGSTAGATGSGARAGAAARPEDAAHVASAAQANRSVAGDGNPTPAATQSAAPTGNAASKPGTVEAGATRSAGVAAPAPVDRAATARTTPGGGKGTRGGATGSGVGSGGPEAPAPGLTARGNAAMSATERALAAEQAAPLASRATPTTGTPMTGRPAAGSTERNHRHTTARYLYSTDNGEKIVGDIDDVTPPVFGGLNLDTTPNPPTTANSTPKR